MNPQSRSRARKSPARAPRRSRSAAVAALLAVAVLASVAVGMIGGGNAMADRMLGHAQATRAHQVLSAPADAPAGAVDLPSVPAGAEDAQPMATF